MFEFWMYWIDTSLKNYFLNFFFLNLTHPNKYLKLFFVNIDVNTNTFHRYFAELKFEKMYLFLTVGGFLNIYLYSKEPLWNNWNN